MGASLGSGNAIPEGRPTSGITVTTQSPGSADAATAAPDAKSIAVAYVAHADELQRFLTGVLKDGELAAEVLQRAFAKALEGNYQVAEGSIKAWLFRVAYNEALLVRRKDAVHERATRELAGRIDNSSSPDLELIRLEAAQKVRTALEGLPAEQRQVVIERIYEGKKFSAIATEQGLPLGTVLTRMKLAIEKLRQKLKHEYD